MAMALQETYERELARIVEQLRTRYGAERILVFGSVARGEVHEDSDIDLIVIKRTDERWIDRVTAALLSVDSRLPVDIVVYTPEEFDARVRRGDPTFLDILSTSRTVYDARAA